MRLFCCIFILLILSCALAISDKYEIDSDILLGAEKGWELFLEQEFSGIYNNGCYTDPRPEKRGYSFWSNEIFAKFDREGDGHFETIFEIQNNQLLYVGSIGGNGRYSHTSETHVQYLDKGMLAPFFAELDKPNTYICQSIGKKTLEHFMQDKESFYSAYLGWKLFLKKEHKSAFGGGCYTDSTPETRGRNFWSNGIYAKHDSDGNGNHETIYSVESGKFEYIGIVDSANNYISTSKEYAAFQNKKLLEPFSELLNTRVYIECNIIE